jgi:hypothetical protein
VKFIVYVTVGQTNADPVALADTARRQANYLGREGFRAMRGQTDERFAVRGFHRLVFRTRARARAFQARVRQICDLL